MKSFMNWVESEESPALSEPQHKQGEANMGLDGLIERRMRQMIMELESSGKGTQQDILASVQKYLGAKGMDQQKQPVQPQDQQQQPQENPNLGQPG